MTDSEMAQANLQSELDRSSKWHNGYAPWWNTMKEDPWWMTTGKAILGEKEFSELAGSHVWRKAGADPLAMFTPAMAAAIAREPSDPLQFKRDILPLIDTFAPLLFMGKGSTPGGMKGAVPRQTGSILKGAIEKVTDFGFPFWSGDPVKFNAPPRPLPNPEKWPDQFTRGLLPGQTKGATSPFDIEGLPYAPRPQPPSARNWLENLKAKGELPPDKLSPGDQDIVHEAITTPDPLENVPEWHPGWQDMHDAMMASGNKPMPPEPPFVESVGDPVGGWNWYYPKQRPELGPTASAMDDPMVQEYLTHLGVDPNDIQVPPPYVGPGTKPPEDIIKEQLQGIHDDISQIYQGKPTPPTWESLSPSQKQWYQDQWNKGILPPKETLPPAPEPYSVQDVANIHELGLKTPERNAGEIQQDWLNFINNIISGDSHQLPGGLEGLGNPKKMRPMYDYNIDPNTYPPPRIAPTPPPEDFDFSQYGYDLPPAPFLVA
jgi:hypothetical protein